ncbi:uncharacterized protein N7469_003864 [Penicillium citrinum]|uniref:40S ribosomal protein S30 n=1 Tax=Penicillium citrinum TaxID=5077 RepID=A0A9W9TPZ9_PENCI|nr:uncharacterized protein N7469_003864 [Penicillium citrinum]KAJ5234696.1 hypothetical protein N7469_003864 [Penicillium citrinum]
MTAPHKSHFQICNSIDGATRFHHPATTPTYPSIANSHPTWVRFTALSPVPVEPQEKKKTPKGRAYKRVLYTRRFVNVTMTGGKRKMNPNPGQ